MKAHELRFSALVWTTRIVRNSLSGLVPPLIPIFAVALEYPLWQLGLLVSLFSLGSGAGQAPMGYLSDTHDRRYILPLGLGVAGGSYLLFSIAPRLGALVPAVPLVPFDGGFQVMAVAMLLCGVGTSAVNPTVYPMITANVRESTKGTVLGIFGSASKFGEAVTPVGVGVLILVLLWEEIVLLFGLFGIGFAVALFVLLGDFETEPATSASDTGPDASPDAADGAEPAAPDRTVWERDWREYVFPLFVNYLFFITKGFASRGVKTFAPAFVVGVYGITLELAGTDFGAESVANFYFSALLIVAGLSQILIGSLLADVDPRAILIGSMLAATAGLLGLASLALSPLGLLLVLVIVGVGIWGPNPARDKLVSDISPAEREGRTFGYLWTAGHLTGAFIPTFVGYLAEAFSLRHSFGALAVGTLLAAAVIALLYSSRVYVDVQQTMPTG